MVAFSPRWGWTVAAALAACWICTGYKQATEKIARVDVNQLLADSNVGKAGLQATTKMNADRTELLRFLAENRVLTEEQLKRIRVLWFKTARSPEETKELEKIKADAQAGAQRSNELLTKTELTKEERALLDDFARRSQTTETYGRQYQQDFAQEVEQAAELKKNETLRVVKAKIQEVAKAQGFSTVFEGGAAPYAANDLTATVLTSLNAQ